MTGIQFSVEGRPAPQGSKRYVGQSKKGNAVLLEMSKYVKPWRSAVVEAATAALPEGWVALDGPLLLEVVFYRLRPASHAKTRMTYPTAAPDLSKLVRSTEDALTTARVWIDDSRVVKIIAEEHFAIPPELTKLWAPGMRSTPGALITISTLYDL
jgi:Holliday junction resolvase RusA-like endonuclease